MQKSPKLRTYTTIEILFRKEIDDLFYKREQLNIDIEAKRELTDF